METTTLLIRDKDLVMCRCKKLIRKDRRICPFCKATRSVYTKDFSKNHVYGDKRNLALVGATNILRHW